MNPNAAKLVGFVQLGSSRSLRPPFMTSSLLSIQHQTKVPPNLCLPSNPRLSTIMRCDRRRHDQQGLCHRSSYQPYPPVRSDLVPEPPQAGAQEEGEEATEGLFVRHEEA
jgi:hypothetical protein